MGGGLSLRMVDCELVWRLGLSVIFGVVLFVFVLCVGLWDLDCVFLVDCVVHVCLCAMLVFVLQ